MAYSIQTLLSDLSGVVHGTTINKVPNIYGAINRAARAVLLDVDPKETQRIVETPQIFNSVYDYVVPPDLKGDRIIDLRPQAGRLPRDVFNQDYAQTFDKTKSLSTANQLYIQHNSGVKTIRIEAPSLTAPITISDTGTLNGWLTDAGLNQITLDQTNNVAGSGALVFDLNSTTGGAVAFFNITNFGTGYSDGSTTVIGGSGSDLVVDITQAGGIINNVSIINQSDSGNGYQIGDVLTIVGGNNDATIEVTGLQPLYYVYNKTLTPIDLTSHIGKSTLFVWTYLPNATEVESINLSWGTDDSNYYYLTVITTQDGKSFQDGWNLLAFPWASASVTGTPTTYNYVSVNYGLINLNVQYGAMICNITSSLGFIYEIQYYSKYIFRDPTTNVFQETVIDSTDDNKIINLDTESYNLLFNKTALFIAQSLQGADAQYDADYWQTEYNNALARYKAQNPSEAIKKTEVYYKMPPKGYGRWLPTMWRRG